MAQRKAVFAALGDVYITVEGGPGVAEEARMAFSRGAAVVPLIRTGSASAGMFDFPAGALEKPAFASQEHWALLSEDCSVASTAGAVVALVAGFLTSKRMRARSAPISGTIVDRQEKARMDRLALTLSQRTALPWLAPYLEKFGPVIDNGSKVLSIVGPYIYSFYGGLFKAYKALPHDAAMGIWGVGKCFFGGRYVAFFTASEAFKSAGGHQALASLQDLQLDVDAVLDANARQEEALGHPTSASEKVALVLRTVDPNRVSIALSSIWSGYMGIVMALKYKFAGTVALAHSIGDNLRPLAAKTIGPSLLAVTPPEYRQWITPSINVSCKVIAMAVAWKLQQIISSVHSGIAGGLLMSRSFLKVGMPFLKSQGLIDPSWLPQDSMLEEVLGWGLAASGIYFQLVKGGSPPLLLLPVTLPISFTETWLQWSVTWMGKD
eukprot:TRINITY_DN30537_c0_g1_i2.p1 TRINITY_DN30537_c0_g1~~TRINITY_DN30537_c0_g1_i2.p1  ORF type:complete len:436 (+),score=89.49 TRINITY_DN30537_c0_g1_i2:289-1596(+)